MNMMGLSFAVHLTAPKKHNAMRREYDMDEAQSAAGPFF